MSTPEERIAALEAKIAGQDVRIAGQESWLRSIDDKLDNVLAAMNKAEGAWFLLLKIAAVIAAIVAAFAWLADHIQAAWK